MDLQSTSTSLESSFAFQNWGLVEYEEALIRQTELVDLVSREQARETIVFCSHPPVVTVGRATQSDDLLSWNGKVVEVSRGGRATYHGPSQLIAYPILDLNLRGRNLHKFFRQIEDAIIRTLLEFEIEAFGRSLQKMDEDMVEATGVWVGPRKIASIGIAVRRWISYHGLALNIDSDPGAFQGLKPCGFSPETMISMQEILGQKLDRSRIEMSLYKNLSLLFLN